MLLLPEFPAHRCSNTGYESTCYSVRPNIKGQMLDIFVGGSGNGSGALKKYSVNTPNRVAAENGSSAYVNFSLNASESSSLYQNDLNEVRVNGLFGLFLIRSY